MATRRKSITDYLAALTPDQRATVDALRSLAAGAGEGVTEHIKWNAPSFAQDGEDRITLGQDKSGKIRVILTSRSGPFSTGDGVITCREMKQSSRSLPDDIRGSEKAYTGIAHTEFSTITQPDALPVKGRPI